MKYEVVFKHWVDGSGFSHEETFDWLTEECTAEEYIKSLDAPIETPKNGDILVEIRKDDEILTSAWVNEQ